MQFCPLFVGPISSIHGATLYPDLVSCATNKSKTHNGSALEDVVGITKTNPNTSARESTHAYS